MINLKMFLAIFLCLLLFCSCEGPEGPVGLAGPDGDQGPQGSQGYRGYQGYQGPPGESAPIPDFAGFYVTTNLEDRYFIFLGVDQFFSVFREYGPSHPDPGNTILICEGYYSWNGEDPRVTWIYFRTSLYDINGSESSYVYGLKGAILNQSLGEPLFEEGEESVEISPMD